MAGHIERKSRSNRKEAMKPEVIAGHKASVARKLSPAPKVDHVAHGFLATAKKHTNPVTGPRSTTYDRKAEEMKAFLAQNPIPEEFLKK